MKRILLSTAIGLLTTVAHAQTVTTPSVQVQTPAGTTVVAPGAPIGIEVQGRVVRTGPDRFVVVDSGAREYTFYTSPRTVYWQNTAPTAYTNVAVGTAITAWYTTDGQKQIVNRVNVLPTPVTGVAPAPQKIVVPAPATVVAPATTTREVLPVLPTGTSPTNFYNPTAFYEGEVLRVASDRVVLRTAAAPEVVVYVNPQTTYRLGERAVALTDLSPGTPVRVDYVVQDNRPFARGVVARVRNP